MKSAAKSACFSAFCNLMTLACSAMLVFTDFSKSGSDVRVTNRSASITLYCSSSKRTQAKQMADYLVREVVGRLDLDGLAWEINIDQIEK